MYLRAALCLLALSGCASRESQTENPLAPATNPALQTNNPGATDDWSRPIKLQAVPRRVVVIGPGATEIAYALGKGSLLVGRDSASDYPAAATKLPVVADYRGPFFEQVRAVRPDFIIVQGETYDAARLDAWQKKCGAPVAGLAATNLKAVQRDVEKIGAWLGVEPGKVRTAVQIDLAPRKEQGTAFVEVSRRPLMTAGSDTLIGDAVAHAGLRNVTELKGYKNYSLETLATQNPRFYVVAAKPAQRALILKTLRSSPGLKELECIRAGRVLVADPDLLLRPGPRLNAGIRQLAEAAKALSASTPPVNTNNRPPA